ncbi:hypothetical protein BH10CYA1_BH10CYA1_40770 [soil metagenome]
MVNKLPSYAICAGGKFAESCGVEVDDIYLIDCPSDSLLPGTSREIGKSGSSAAIISLAVFAGDRQQAESIRIGMAISDFGVPVIPSMVPESWGDSAMALAAQKAALTASQLVDFYSMLAEFRLAQGLAEWEDDHQEAPAVAKPRAASARRSSAGATTNGRRTTRKSRK